MQYVSTGPVRQPRRDGGSSVRPVRWAVAQSGQYRPRAEWSEDGRASQRGEPGHRDRALDNGGADEIRTRDLLRDRQAF